MDKRIWNRSSLDSVTNWLIVVAVLSYGLLIYVGWISFSLWPQVEYLYTNFGGVALGDLYSHPHAHRYQLVRGIYTLAELTGVDRHLWFSVVCSVVLLSLSWGCAKLVVLRTKTEYRAQVFLACLLLFGGLAWFMNGRLIIGMLASLMLLWFVWSLGNGRRYEVLLYFVLTLIFAGVTSGVFLSIGAALFVAIMYAGYNDWQNGNLLSRFPMYIGLGLCGLLFVPLASMLVLKNVAYYEGQVSEVASHGLGYIVQIGATFSVKQKLFHIVWLYGILNAFIYMGFASKNAQVHQLVDRLVILILVTLLTLSIYAYSIVFISTIPTVFVSLVVMVNLVDVWKKYA